VGCQYVEKAIVYISVGFFFVHPMMQMSADILSLSKKNALAGCLCAPCNALDKFKLFFFQLTVTT
jgi:hypothetical protein